MASCWYRKQWRKPSRARQCWSLWPLFTINQNSTIFISHGNYINVLETILFLPYHRLDCTFDWYNGDNLQWHRLFHAHPGHMLHVPNPFILLSRPKLNKFWRLERTRARQTPLRHTAEGIHVHRWHNHGWCQPISLHLRRRITATCT